MIEVGLIQLDHGSPALPPDGTRPDAIAPATAPMQYGTMTEEMAKRPPNTRCWGVRTRTLRNAKLEPRSTMPSAASVSGTNSVSMTDAKTSENAVHSTTRQKINHTWLASHTGPIECSISPRARLPRTAPPAVRSQNPAPKSAPPNSAYAVIPNNNTPATTSASLIRCSPARLRFAVGLRRHFARPVGDVRVVLLDLFSE